MAKILIIYHSQTGNTEKLARAVADGAKQVGAEVVFKKTSETTAEDFFGCDGLAIGSPNYFSYMAGTVKDFFDRVYYQAKDKVADKPYVIFVTHGGGGGEPVIEAMERVCRSFKLRKVGELAVHQEPQSEDFKKAEELGKTLVHELQ